MLSSLYAGEGMAAKQRCSSERRSIMLKGRLGSDGLFYERATTCGDTLTPKPRVVRLALWQWIACVDNETFE